jgi:hypothetical protein
MRQHESGLRLWGLLIQLALIVYLVCLTCRARANLPLELRILLVVNNCTTGRMLLLTGASSSSLGGRAANLAELQIPALIC